MHHLIIGYGYCGYHLARHLLSHQQTVTVISRHLDESMQLPGLNHLIHDISNPLVWQTKNTIIYYLIPPSRDSEQDNLLQQFLAHSSLQVSKVVYFSSSGVYGDHQGAWIDEQSSCNLKNLKQRSRLSAEQQWLTYCKLQSVECIALRVAGIFGPNRLPVQSAIAQTPLIEPDAAPYINHIYIHDLVDIAYQLAIKAKVSSVYNLADGQPTRMGALQQQVAHILGLEAASCKSWQQIWQEASPMKREFMEASKRLRINALQTTLKQSLHLTLLVDAVRESLIIEGKLS